MFTVCVCMHMYFCICMRVCLCIYNQSSVSLAQIFLLTTRLRPNCPCKINTCKTKPIIFLNLPSLLFLTVRTEGHLPYQSPRIGSQESFQTPSLQTNVLIPGFSLSLITLIILLTPHTHYSTLLWPSNFMWDIASMPPVYQSFHFC